MSQDQSMLKAAFVVKSNAYVIMSTPKIYVPYKPLLRGCIILSLYFIFDNVLIKEMGLGIISQCRIAVEKRETGLWYKILKYKALLKHLKLYHIPEVHKNWRV